MARRGKAWHDGVWFGQQWQGGAAARPGGGSLTGPRVRPGFSPFGGGNRAGLAVQPRPGSPASGGVPGTTIPEEDEDGQTRAKADDEEEDGEDAGADQEEGILINREGAGQRLVSAANLRSAAGCLLPLEPLEDVELAILAICLP